MNVRENILCAVDVETTGRRPGFHEVIQIAVVPINGQKPFYTVIQPDYPERQEEEASFVHRLTAEVLEEAPSRETAQDMLVEWFRALDPPVGFRVVPLAHNWAFESAFLKAWLGTIADDIFHSHARDTMLQAVWINDRAVARGREPDFPSVGLVDICKQLGIPHDNPHDAKADAVAGINLYKKLLTWPT